MIIKQISVFLENKKGRLAKLTRVLQENNIDITAISIADTANFGVIRLIVNQPEKAEDIIRNSNFTVKTAEVIAVEVPDTPGGLHEVLDILNQNEISIEYLYSFVRKPSDSALILFKVEGPEDTIKILENNSISILTSKEVYKL